MLSIKTCGAKGLFALALMLMMGAAQAVPIVSSSINAGATLVGAVRYRSFSNSGGQEIYEGIPDLGVAANRTARDINWVAGDNSITFTYDALTDRLSTSVTNSNGTYSLDDNAAFDYATGTPFINYLQINVVDRSTASQVDFNNVVLNGASLGSFVGDNAFADYGITNINLTNGFTLTGIINLAGTFSSSQELNRVDVLFGYDRTAPVPNDEPVVPEPTTLGLVGLGLVGFARRMRRKA